MATSADADGPLTVPVNYRMDGSDVLFRVSPTSQMCLHLNKAAVSFEVDRIDEFHQGPRPVCVRIRPSRITGPRLVDEKVISEPTS